MLPTPEKDLQDQPTARDNMVEMYNWLTTWNKYNTDSNKRSSTETTEPSKRKKLIVPRKN